MVFWHEILEVLEIYSKYLKFKAEEAERLTLPEIRGRRGIWHERVWI